MVSSFSIHWHFIIGAPSLSDAKGITTKIVAAIPMVSQSNVEEYWKFEDSYSLRVTSELTIPTKDTFQEHLAQFRALIETFGNPWTFRSPVTFDHKIEGSAILSTNTGAIANMNEIEWINAEYSYVP